MYFAFKSTYMSTDDAAYSDACCVFDCGIEIWTRT